MHLIIGAMGSVAAAGNRRGKLRRCTVARFDQLAKATPDLPKCEIAAQVAKHTALGRVSAHTVPYWVRTTREAASDAE